MIQIDDTYKNQNLSGLDWLQDPFNQNDEQHFQHQPPLICSSSLLRPLQQNDLHSVSVPFVGKVRISNENGPASDLIYHPPIHPSLSSQIPNSIVNSISNASSSYQSNYSARITTAVVHQINMNPGGLGKPQFLRLKLDTDIPSGNDNREGNVGVTDDIDIHLDQDNIKADEDDDDEEILPFTPGTPTRMKGWTRHLHSDRPLFNHLDSEIILERDQSKTAHLITSDHFYHPLHSNNDDDDRMIEFDKETFGRRDSLRELVERTGMMAARRRFSP